MEREPPVLMPVDGNSRVYRHVWWEAILRGESPIVAVDISDTRDTRDTIAHRLGNEARWILVVRAGEKRGFGKRDKEEAGPLKSGVRSTSCRGRLS
jgi:hypothetical protein